MLVVVPTRRNAGEEKEEFAEEQRPVDVWKSDTDGDACADVTEEEEEWETAAAEKYADVVEDAADTKSELDTDPAKDVVQDDAEEFVATERSVEEEESTERSAADTDTEEDTTVEDASRSECLMWERGAEESSESDTAFPRYPSVGRESAEEEDLPATKHTEEEDATENL